MVSRTSLSIRLVLPALWLASLPFPVGTVRAQLDAATSPQPGLEAPTEGTGAEPLIRSLRSVPTVSPDTWDVVVLKLALAGALGLILALVYRASYTGKRKKYKPSMMQCQLLLCVGGAMIWIIVSGNIVRAFGLAGALSLIRYRTPVRDPKDTVVVFLSMLVGMACGLALYYVALIATGFISLLLFGIYEFRLGKKKKKPKAEKPALFED